MADFINFEADIDNDKTSSSDEHDMSGDDDDDDDDNKNSFINDNEINESRDFIDNLQTLKMI